jgi:hypothetical protein
MTSASEGIDIVGAEELVAVFVLVVASRLVGGAPHATSRANSKTNRNVFFMPKLRKWFVGAAAFYVKKGAESSKCLLGCSANSGTKPQVTRETGSSYFDVDAVGAALF